MLHDHNAPLCVAPHIHNETGAITKDHIAYKHLQGMRSRLGVKSIDERGIFVDAETAETRIRIEGDGRKVGATVNAEILTQMLECTPQLFPWSAEWEDEWQEVEYRMDVLPRWLLFVTCGLFTCAFVQFQARSTPYSPLTPYGLSIVGFGSLLLYIAIKRDWIPSKKQRRWYPTIVLVWIVSVHFIIIYVTISRERARGSFAGDMSIRQQKCERTGHVFITFNYSTFGMTARTCKDRDQLKTVTKWPYIWALGCETLVLDSTFPRTLEVLFLFIWLRCSWKTVVTGVIITKISILLACCAVGTYGWHVLCHCLLHLGVGCVIAYSCLVNTQESREQFAQAKHVKLAGKQRRSALQALIPPNVLARLATHSSDMGCLATDIPQCTIMFCSLSRHQEQANDTDTEDFRRLHGVCLDFDDAVRMSGLYKYQHVGAWYIVTCPNAAAPFEVATDSSCKTRRAQRSEESYAEPSYASGMAELALKLMSVAHHHGFDLQVGMHTGAAAGAVIGSLRAFYCIYGHAVNTASRLCRNASSGQILCTQGFVTCLNAEGQARLLCRSSSAARCDAKCDASYSSSPLGGGGTCTADTLRPLVRCCAYGSVCYKGLEPIEVFVILHEFKRDDKSVLRKRTSGVHAAESFKSESLKIDAFNVDAFSVLPAMTRRNSSYSSNSSFSSFSEDRSVLPAMTRRNSSYSSFSESDTSERGGLVRDPVMSMLQCKDLSDESLAFLNKTNLNDWSTEAHYKQDLAQRLRRRVSAGIAIHLLGILFQRSMILYPEFSYDFEVLGPSLKVAYASVLVCLREYLWLQTLLCLALFFAIIKGPGQWANNVSIMLGVLRLSWLPFSLYLSTIWPVKQYTLVFPPLYSMLHLWGETGLQTSFRNMVIFYVLNFAMFLIMLIPIRDMMPPVFLVRTLITTTCTAILNVWFCDASQLRWRLHRVFQYEMRRFDYILNDLLPSTFDQSCTHSADASGDHYIGKLKVNLAYDNYLRDSTLPFHHERNAIVLQLDLCSFTEFSRKISPMELAQTLHQLFSRFDSTVRSLNLFKMDTVGDAYIVSAWLTAHEADSIRQNPEYMPNARKSCHSVLWLAGMMLNTIDSYRTKDGHEITARIGVAVGTVVVGSLGSMQPRIHIRGYGMRKAEELEQQGTPGMVNVCDKFLNILSAAHIPANNSTSRDTFMEDPPQHARFVEGTRKRRGQKISWSRPDLDLQGWSIVETRRTSQAEDGDDEPTLGQGHNANNVSGLVGTSFILQRPPTAHWESNRGGEVLSSETPCRKPK